MIPFSVKGGNLKLDNVRALDSVVKAKGHEQTELL